MEFDASGGEVLHVIVHRGWQDVSGVSLWLSLNVERWFAGQHDADEEIKTTHTHLMLVSLKVSQQALRDHLKAHGIMGRGQLCIMEKTHKSPRVPYSERVLGTYICKGDSNVPRGYHGYSQEDIQWFIGNWVGFVKRVVGKNSSEERKLVVALTREETPKRPDMWEQIRNCWFDYERDHKEAARAYGVKQIVSFINSYYLRKGQSIPRSADSHRWAKSLWYLTKANFQEELLTYEFVEKFSGSVEV